MAHLKEDDTQTVQVHLLCVVGGGGESERGRRGKEGAEQMGKVRGRREVCVSQSTKVHIHVYLPVYT